MTAIPVSDYHRNALKLDGLEPETSAVAGYRNPDGSTGTFHIPAAYGFRCLGVCPSYWSLDHLCNYAHGHSVVKPGSSVWYVVESGRVKLA